MRRQIPLSVAAALAMTSALALQTADRMEAAQFPLDAVVQFGPEHPQPPTPGNHVLVPDEVTIHKGGTVTFQVNGGGHGVAIYPVHKHTTRDDIVEDLCPDGPGAPACPSPVPGGTPSGPGILPYIITDGKGDTVIETGAFSDNNLPYFDYVSGRLAAVIGGTAIFLNGSVPPPVPPATTPAAAPGVALTYRFEKTGRYLVICMNRFHAVNDYMFGFVNVVGGN